LLSAQCGQLIGVSLSQRLQLGSVSAFGIVEIRTNQLHGMSILLSG
jgi:hypothetical protein